jgi:uncharacterized iron-regulated membrane protein
MPVGEGWIRRPQSLGVRKAIFQVHLWTGMGIGVYVLLMSLSGSVLIYRRELARVFSREPVIVAGSSARMTADELKQAAKRAYPGYEVTRIFVRRQPDQPVEIWLERGKERVQRLFDPYTSADLGNTLRFGFRVTAWLVDFHDNLLYGRTGRLINGVGGILATLLCITGAIIWWPGIDKWRRSLIIDWRKNSKRFNWTLHSALGFWSLAFIFMWGISGIYLSFPGPFNATVDYFNPANSGRKVRLGDQILDWLAKLHFGRFAGLPVKIVWTVFGLVPAALFVTGTLMWWNRVLRPWLERGVLVRPQISEAKQAEPF